MIPKDINVQPLRDRAAGSRRAPVLPAAVKPKQAERVPERYLTPREAAERLSISIHTLRGWCAQRRIGYVKWGRSNRAMVRIPEGEIERLVRAHLRPALVAMPAGRARTTPESAA